MELKSRGLEVTVYSSLKDVRQGVFGAVVRGVYSGNDEVGVEAFIQSLDVPTRLRDVGAKEDELHIVAEEVIKESSIWHDHKSGEESFLGLLKQMW